ncbi:MAG: hypothetical protein QM765_28075 [Myxococcales bacterium]
MSRWKEMLKQKMLSIEEAVQLVKSGDDVIVAQCASEPQGLMGKLHLVKDKVHDVKVFSVLTLKPYDFYMKPEMKGHFELCSWFHAPGSREALKANTGTVTYVPNMLHRAGLDRIHVKKPNVFLGTCTPMDSKGYVSLSLGVTYEKDVLEQADLVILEINENLPRTFGDTHVHVSDVHHFVEYHQEVPTLPAPNPDKTDLAIGNYIAELVPDEATIQLGIGGIPNAAAFALKNKKNLGVHTEMMVDSMMELYENGRGHQQEEVALQGQVHLHLRHGLPEALRLDARQHGGRGQARLLGDRPFHHPPELEDGLHQHLPDGRLQRPGLQRVHRPAAVLGHRRPGRHHHRRPRRLRQAGQGDHRLRFHRQEGHGLDHRPHAAHRQRRHAPPLGHRPRSHRARHRLPAWPDDPRADEGAHRHRRPEVPRGADGRGEEDRLLVDRL